MPLTAKQIQDQYVDLVAVAETIPQAIHGSTAGPSFKAGCLAQWAGMSRGNRLCMVAEYDLDPRLVIHALWNDYQIDNPS